MNALKKNWWKLVIVIFVGLAIDIIAHEFIPESDSTNDVLSTVSEAIGMIPTIILFFVVAFGSMVVPFVLIEEQLGGHKLTKGLRYGIAIGGLWYIGMFEGRVLSGLPIAAQVSWAVADALPIVLTCLLLALWVGSSAPHEEPRRQTWKGQRWTGILVVGVAFMIGRYVEYEILQPQMGYDGFPVRTFIWTMITGLWAGVMYRLLVPSLRGIALRERLLWFVVGVFGIQWWLFNIFVPLILIPPREAFTMGAVSVRVVIDTLSVLIAVFSLEKLAESRQNTVRTEEIRS